MKTVIRLLLVLILTQSASAQESFSEYKKRYNQAIQLYANSQYDNAIQAFLPLTNEKFNNALVPYSHYYVALCANNITNFAQSKTSLRQLFQRFPDWDKIDEAYYLYAEASFNQKRPDEALNYLNRIQNRDIQKSIPNMEYKYLSELTDFYQIKDLQIKFPNNKTLAELFVKSVHEKSYVTREELALSDELTNRFNLIKKKKTGFSRAYDDESIDFGVLLPFNIAEVTNSSSTQKPYPYDIYAGLKLATKQLNSEGIKTTIFAFDIGKEGKEMMNLVNDNNFKRIDLFVGPLYPSPNKIAVEFAMKNKVLQVHPLSNNLSLTAESDGIFLALPSYTDQSKKALEFAKELSNKKTVAIYFGRSSKDNEFAKTYKLQAEKNGFEVIDFKQIQNPNDINSQISPNHIFLATMPEETKGIVQAIRKNRSGVPIFSGAESFDFSSFPMSMLADKVYIIYPEYVDLESQEVQNFRDTYVAMMGELPSYYAYLGYDIGLYYSRVLKEGKDRIKDQMNMIQYTKGYTLSGFDYTGNSKSNQLIPIVKYENGKFRELTR